VIEGSHCLMAVGSVPNTAGLGLEAAGVRLNSGGFVEVDRVSRTSAGAVYAAGDCTGVLMLASVAAQQAGSRCITPSVTPSVRWLSTPLRPTSSPSRRLRPWVGPGLVESGEFPARTVMLPLATNARAKMQGLRDGFVKLFCRSGTGIVMGGVVVAPRASELIFPISLAVDSQLSVDQLAHAFTVYPSMSGSLAEAARLLRLPTAW